MHPDWRYTTTVKARWRYHYRSHVSAVQTIKRSTTTEPTAWYENLTEMQSCGWRPGVPNITLSANDDRHEYEVQWYYKHPVVKAIIPWGHGSRVRPWYGNRTKVQYNDKGEVQ